MLLNILQSIGHVCALSHFSPVRLFATLWTVLCQAPLSIGFFRQEYWSGLPCPPPGDLPSPVIEPVSPVVPALQAHSLPLSHQGSPVSRTAPHTKISQLKNINSPEVKKKTCYILTLESKLLLLWITLVFSGSFLAIVYNC